VIMMAGTLRVRRSRGALSGSLLVLLGIWGALIPFVGPYFNYAYSPNRTWDATSGRLWLEVLPGVVTLAGGVLVVLSRFRLAMVFGSWLAALAGAWFAVGDLVAGHGNSLPAAGAPVGSATRQVFEQIGFFTGLGVVIVFVAALALGRFTVVAVSDAAAAESELAAAAKAAAADASAADAAADRKRIVPRVNPVPVFRGRSRTADTPQAEATSATATAEKARAR
jgi:hypothetical protein